MRVLSVLLSALVAVSTAMVCPPDYCDSVQQPLLDCHGGVLKNAGFCGCTDHCAKVEFETCKPNTFDILMMGVPNTEVCDEGLECRTAYLGDGKSHSICMKADSKDGFVSKRANLMACPPNACDNVKQEELNCLGGVHKNGGFCGCTDVCAKVAGENCVPTNLGLLGAPDGDQCDEGLVCHTAYLGEGRANSVCTKPEDLFVSKRSNLMVCPPNVCDNVKQVELNCLGGVRKSGGLCGCTDVCAKVEGEHCTPASIFLGMPNVDVCDEGLMCKETNLEGHVFSKCVDPLKTDGDLLMSKRGGAIQCDTPCRRKSLQCTFSFVIYEGQWFAKCDQVGNFLTEQCNNKKECFCVNHLTGAIDETTRVLGSANCL